MRQPARLIGGEAGSGCGFTADPNELRVVLGFPDTYEIGISNQAIQILYHLAQQVDGVAVERTYLPWVDVIAEMRRERLPLLTVETWSPVAEAGVVGFTLQHEFGFTNVLEMLDLAGIPLRASERTEGHPLGDRWRTGVRQLPAHERVLGCGGGGGRRRALSRNAARRWSGGKREGWVARKANSDSAAGRGVRSGPEHGRRAQVCCAAGGCPVSRRLPCASD